LILLTAALEITAQRSRLESGLRFSVESRTIWIVDAHCDDGQRFFVHADEKLSAFLELERVTSESLRL
jgi:hypothetical protein